jgi:hypothetical protein
VIALLTLCVPLVGGCKNKDAGTIKQDARSIKQDVRSMVWMDQWWNVDYPKTRCEEEDQLHPESCIEVAKNEVLDYQLRVATAFATDTTCHGFTLTGTHGNTTENITGANWQLMFDFERDEEKQSWSLVDTKTSQVVGMGTDGPRETAHSICIVMAKKGGSVE